MDDNSFSVLACDDANMYDVHDADLSDNVSEAATLLTARTKWKKPGRKKRKRREGCGQIGEQRKAVNRVRVQSDAVVSAVDRELASAQSSAFARRCSVAIP